MRPIPTEPMLENCERCAKETRHVPDADGGYHCAVCKENDRQAAREAYRAKNLAQWKQVLKWLVPIIGAISIAVGVARCVQDDGRGSSSSYERCKERMREQADRLMTDYDPDEAARFCRASER